MKLLKWKFSIFALVFSTILTTTMVAKIFLKHNPISDFQKVWAPVKDKTLISNYKVDEVISLNIKTAKKDRNPFLIYHPHSKEYQYTEKDLSKEDKTKFSELKTKLLSWPKNKKVNGVRENQTLTQEEKKLINKYWLQFLPFLKHETLKSLTLFNEEEYLNEKSNKVFGQIPNKFLENKNNISKEQGKKKSNFIEAFILNKFSFPIYFEKESELPESFALYFTRNPLKDQSNLFSLFIKNKSESNDKNQKTETEKIENSHQKIFKNSELPNFVIWLRENLPKMAVKRTIHTPSDIHSFAQTVDVFERYLATLYSLSWHNQKKENKTELKKIPSFNFKNLQAEDFSDCLLEFNKSTTQEENKKQKTLCLSKSLIPITKIRNSFFK